MQTPDAIVHRVRFVTAVGMLVNILLTLGKGAGGVLFHSQALLADAIHSFSDLATDLVVIFGVRYWSAPPDESHPYGHGKIETFIAFLIGAALVLVSVGLIGDAWKTLDRGTGCAPELPAFFLALLSIVSKETLFRWTRRSAKTLNSPAMEANAWHHRSDAVSSVPAAIAIAVAYFRPELYFVDAAGAVLVSLFILHSAWVIIKPALGDLVEAGAVKKQQEIRRIALAMPEVRAVHAVRTRSVGSVYHTDLHVMVDPELTVRRGHAIAHDLKTRILSAPRLGVSDVVIHIEPFESAETEQEKQRNP